MIALKSWTKENKIWHIAAATSKKSSPKVYGNNVAKNSYAKINLIYTKTCSVLIKQTPNISITGFRSSTCSASPPSILDSSALVTWLECSSASSSYLHIRTPMVEDQFSLSRWSLVPSLKVSFYTLAASISSSFSWLSWVLHSLAKILLDWILPSRVRPKLTKIMSFPFTGSSNL